MAQAGLLELNAVVAVSTHKNFRRAAEELGLSPSALSHAIASLEKRLGVRLFNRTTRNVALSEAGERFLARVRPALREITAAMEPTREPRDTPMGTLRISATEYGARFALPASIAFLRRYPDMRLEIDASEATTDATANGFDARICLTEDVPPGMEIVPCGPTIEFVVVATPQYYAARGKPSVPMDLLGHNCIRRRLEEGGIYRWEFLKDGEEFVLDVPGTLTIVGRNPLIVEAALEGLGVAFVNRWWVEEHIAAGRLATCLEDWLLTRPGTCLYYPTNRYASAGLKAFAEAIRLKTPIMA